jgi:hypothetical protein
MPCVRRREFITLVGGTPISEALAESQKVFAHLGNDFEPVSFCIVSGPPALHLDNTFLENDYPQLSCLA